MITVDTRPGAIVLLVFALILLGTWVGPHAPVHYHVAARAASADACHVIIQGPLLNLAERRGRHTVHTYMVDHQHALPIDALLHEKFRSAALKLCVQYAAERSHSSASSH